MPSNARMTIRFEPPAKPKQPSVPGERHVRQPIIELVEPEEKPALVQKEARTGFAAWNSPYQDDIHALEEIIRKTDTDHRIQPIIVREAEVEAPFDEIIASDGGRFSGGSDDVPREGGWYAHLETLEPERETGPSWGRVILSVAAAIGTGILFGYMILSLFTGAPLFPGKTDAILPVQATLENPSQTATSPATSRNSSKTAGSNTADAAQPSAQSASAPVVEVAGADYYLLQYGVFKSKESMETAARQLRDKGISAATDIGDGYRVYAGAATSRSDAELLAAVMPGMDIYIKPGKEETLAVSTDALTLDGAQFMNASAELIRKLVLLSGAGIQEDQPRKFGDKDMASLQDSAQTWLKASGAANKMGEGMSDHAGIVVQALNSALASATDFNDKPSRELLWSIQSDAMKALLADRHIRAELGS